MHLSAGVSILMSSIQEQQQLIEIDIVFLPAFDVCDLVGHTQPADTAIGQSSAISCFSNRNHDLFIVHFSFLPRNMSSV